VRRLGELERTVMDVLWDSEDPLTARDMARRLADRDLAYTTVMTVLDRLTKKGLLRRERAGRAWRYRPVAGRDTYVVELMFDALDMTGDREAALTRLVRSLPTSDAESLRKALAEPKAGGTEANRDEP
jgi:predicted transcriptional regulator